jgi:hypothetical protein
LVVRWARVETTPVTRLPEDLPAAGDKDDGKKCVSRRVDSALLDQGLQEIWPLGEGRETD